MVIGQLNDGTWKWAKIYAMKGVKLTCVSTIISTRPSYQSIHSSAEILAIRQSAIEIATRVISLLPPDLLGSLEWQWEYQGPLLQNISI